MIMPPPLRKFALAVHLTCSVGWVGAGCVYLVLVLAAMATQEAETLRVAWNMMQLSGWYVIVPLAIISLLSGLLMGLGTKWGLFRHYWVLISFVLTCAATAVLIQHMQTVNFFASLAANSDAALDVLRSGLSGELLHAGVGLVVLLIVQVLNVYKPQGLTPYGWKKVKQRSASDITNANTT